MRKKLVALFPGSFNPSTLAHRAVGMAVRDLVRPDEVWYLVSPQNPHKSTEGMARFEDRLAMAKLNVCGLNRIVATGIEKEISEATGSTATIDTLQELAKRFPDTRFALIIGADNFTQLHSWKNYEHILECVPLIVLPRAGSSQLIEHAPITRKAGFEQLTSPDDLRSKSGWLYLHQFPEGNISATRLREQIRRGEGPDPAATHPGVIKYIQARHLNF